MKGEPLVMVEMLSSSQPPVTVLPSGLQEADAFPMQILRDAQGEDVGHVEGGRTFFGMGVEGILRRGLGDRARGSGDESADDGTGVVERLRPGVAGLDAGAAVGHGSRQRGLQGVVGGVGGAGDDVLGAKAADDVARWVELGVRREAGPAPG